MQTTVHLFGGHTCPFFNPSGIAQPAQPIVEHGTEGVADGPPKEKAYRIHTGSNQCNHYHLGGKGDETSGEECGNEEAEHAVVNHYLIEYIHREKYDV